MALRKNPARRGRSQHQVKNTPVLKLTIFGGFRRPLRGLGCGWYFRLRIWHIIGPTVVSLSSTDAGLPEA